VRQPAVKGLDAVIFLYLSFVIQTSLIHNANLYDCLNMLSQEINTLPIHTCECGDYVHECHHLHREHFQCFLTSGFLAHLRWYHLGQMSHPTHCFSCPILKVFSHSAHELVSTLAHAFFLAGNGCTCSGEHIFHFEYSYSCRRTSHRCQQGNLTLELQVAS